MFGELIELAVHVGIQVLLQKAEKEFNRWVSTREEVEFEIKRQKKEINIYLRQSSDLYNYKVMINMHYESFMVADQAYSLLSDARLAMDAIGKSILSTREQRDELVIKKNAEKKQDLKRKTQKEINSILELRKKLFSDKDILKEQRISFQQKVKELNKQTHDLKIAIRDHTGHPGADWYERLEERKRGRN